MARKQAGNINVDFDARTQGLRRAEADVRRAAGGMSRNFRRAQGETAKLTAGVRGLSGHLRGLAGVMSAVGAGFALQLTRGLTSYSAGMVELSLRTGESTRALQELRIALESDTGSLDISQFTRLVTNWARVVQDAKDGSEEYADVFRQLNLDPAILQARGLQQSMLDLADATAKVTEEGRALEATGHLATLLGSRQAGVAAAFTQRGRLAANIDAARQIPIPTQAELQRNKDLGQAFNDLTNTVRNTLIIALSNAAGGLENFTRGLQRAIPAAAGGVSGTLGDPAFQRRVTAVAAAGGILATLASLRKLRDAFHTAVIAWTWIGEGGIAYAIRNLTRFSAWALPVYLLFDVVTNIFRRARALQEVSAPIDFTWLGETVPMQIEGVQRGLELARSRLAAAQAATAALADDNILFRAWRYFAGSGEAIEEEVALANVRRWERALEAVNEVAADEAARAERIAAASQRARDAARAADLSGLITDIGDLFRALAPLPEFVHPQFNIASRIVRDPNAGRTLDLTGLSLRPAGLEGTPTPYHVLGDARELAAEFRIHEQILANVAIEVGDALGDLVDTITEKDASLRDALSNLLRGLSRAITSGVGAGLTDRLLVGLGLRAGGGYASGLTLVGERGPELLDFRNPAMVYSNAQLGAALRGGGGAGGVTINYAPTINAVDAVGVEGVLVRQRKELIEAVNAEFLHRSGYSNPLTQRYDAPGF